MDDILFFKIWRNIFIKSNIFYHLRRYIENDKVKIYSMEQLEDYKWRSYISKLEIQPNEPLEPKGIIPEVSELEFSFKFNQIIKKGDIPNSVKKIKIWNYDYSQRIEEGSLPNSLEYLKMTGENSEIPFGANRILPNNLKELIIISFFQFIPLNSMPSNLKILKIRLGSGEFNPHVQIKGSLPQSLTTLHFDGFFQKLENSIFPNSITDLSLRDFNHPINSNDLPSSLKILSLASFNHPIDQGLSSLQHLEHLTFGMFDNQIQPGELPLSLKYLNIGEEFDQEIIVDSLPSSLETLLLSVIFDHPILPNSLPINLKSIYLGHWFNQPLEIGSLNNGLTSIQFGYHYQNMIAPGVLPSSITSIAFSNPDYKSYIAEGSISNNAMIHFDDLELDD